MYDFGHNSLVRMAGVQEFVVCQKSVEARARDLDRQLFEFGHWWDLEAVFCLNYVGLNKRYLLRLIIS
jgi:hypothetical protein